MAIEILERDSEGIAIARCSCGRKLHLYNSLDNECSCGKCYNSSGQSVVPSWECDEQGNPIDHD
jgi:hypothetical protein